MVSVVVGLCDLSTHILHGYFPGTGAIIWLPTGAIIWLPQCQGSNPEGYGYIWLISKCDKVPIMCIYCMHDDVIKWKPFPMLLAICAGNSPVPGEFPTQRPVTWSFDVFFDLPPNKQLSKQWWGWWFGTQSCLLWHHNNGLSFCQCSKHKGYG